MRPCPAHRQPKRLAQRQRRLLHNFFGLNHIGRQRGHISKDLPFAAQEQRQEPLLGGAAVGAKLYANHHLESRLEPGVSGSDAVQDILPAGWTATNISDDGAFTAAGGTVQWGPFFDNQARALSYTAVPPAVASGVAAFTGTASFDGSAVTITGRRQTVPANAPSPAPAVQLVRMTLNNGQFQFDFTNTTGLPVTVYATTNLSLPLSRWQTLGTPQSLGGGVYRFTAATETNHVQRFYRLH